MSDPCEDPEGLEDRLVGILIKSVGLDEPVVADEVVGVDIPVGLEEPACDDGLVDVEDELFEALELPIGDVESSEGTGVREATPFEDLDGAGVAVGVSECKQNVAPMPSPPSPKQPCK